MEEDDQHVEQIGTELERVFGNTSGVGSAGIWLFPLAPPEVLGVLRALPDGAGFDAFADAAQAYARGRAPPSGETPAGRA